MHPHLHPLLLCWDPTLLFCLQSLCWQAATSASTPRLPPASPYPTIDLTDEDVILWSSSNPSVDRSPDSHQEGMGTTQVGAESRGGDSTEYQVPQRWDFCLKPLNAENR